MTPDLAPAAEPAHASPSEIASHKRLSRRRLLQVLVRGGLGAAVLGAGGLAYAHEVEPERLGVNRQDILIAGLPRAFDGLSIAHLSDIHMDAWMTRARIEKVCRLANSLRPDVIVATGDFISRAMWQENKDGTRRGDIAPGLSEALSVLEAPLGVWGVLGNHDHWASGEEVSLKLKLAGVRELRNAIAPLERGGSRLWLCGVDDLWAGKPDLPGVLRLLEEKSSPDEVALLMVHEPDFADMVATHGRFSLQMSGHSHGGQVALPFIGPPVLPAMGRKYHTGLYQLAAASTSARALQVFTSRGIGVAGPRVRLNCPPEVALLTLRSA
jgi:predicted MPP superfamily phosphohydrolase